VNNTASTAWPEDNRGRLASVVLGIDGSRQRPSLQRCLELRLEDDLAQGRMRRMSDAATSGLGRSNDDVLSVWWREEQSGGKGAEAAIKEQRRQQSFARRRKWIGIHLGDPIGDKTGARGGGTTHWRQGWWRIVVLVWQRCGSVRHRG
jgi:hypothetical protein